MTDEKKRPPNITDQTADDTPTPPMEDKAAPDPGHRERVVTIKREEYDPTLDPESPEFDREKWDAMRAEMQENIKGTVDNILDAAGIPINDLLQAAGSAINFMQAAGQAITGAINKLAIYSKSEEWRELVEAVREFAKNAPEWVETIDEYNALTPYLEEELKKPEYEGKTISELMDAAAPDEDGNPIETSLFMQAWRAAQEARAAAEAKEEPPQAIIKRAETVEYPLDKPNSLIWNLLEKDTKGQVSFNMATDKDKQKGVSLPAFYSINFDNLSNDISITKRLLPFDKLVYIATAALYNAGNNVITLSQICYAMGYTTPQGDNIRDKIYRAITKMRTADIYFDNGQEAKKYNYTWFKYEGALLPCEIGQAIINGKKTDKAIHIFREPPLITFAKQRKQITTLDIKLLQAPVSKTDANLLIQDYLLERISKAKNGKAHSCRILYKTLYAHTGIADKPKTEKEKKQKQRAPIHINKYLTHYQKESFIKRFTTQNDGITVYW